MRWFKPDLRNSLYALFSGGPGSHRKPAPKTVYTIEDVRTCMMALVPEDGSEQAGIVHRRICYADGAETLWFLRGELMGVLAKSLGEEAAFDEIAVISNMFDDLLPNGLRSRPSPLGRG